ncbi:cholinesterase-like [Contarinia nasturtii]|uniref:cholinesterase-like n=1 Tax=Contarinia nasturtii TaxID=265458 RepID=UPI0012D39034|nr:cholinesterase-like [Contarinia nasturtii]
MRHQTVLGNGTFCSYRGIRYAEAPVGQLRFKAPVPTKRWNGTYNALEYGAACLQPSATAHGSSEDCLFLNVFVPSPSICTTSNNIAVIVYIHGGGFLIGSAVDSLSGPHLMLNKCIILVTFNYRLGVFGFMPLALNEYSGNMGLKDQQLALEWVNSHISAFGGNPKQITLWGHSAGAASVSLHRLNPKSRSLFKQAYIMSYSALSFAALSEPINKTDLIVNVARHEGVNIENIDQLVKYIQAVDGKYFLKQTSRYGFKGKNITLYIEWIPCIELENAVNPFITEDPKVLLAQGVNISTIYSHTSMESIKHSIDIITDPNRISYLNKNFTFELPFIGIDQMSCKEEIAPLFTDIRRFYFGKHPIDAQIRPYIQLRSSVNFVYSIQKEIAIQALSNSTVDIRLLRVSQKTALNNHQNISAAVDALGGTAHADDLCSYFWCKVKSHIYDEVAPQETLLQKSTVKASEILREILTSFAITGNPVSETASFDHFPTVGSDPLNKLPFAELHSMSALVVGNNPDYEEFKFWWNIDQRVEEIKKMPCNQKGL